MNARVLAMRLKAILDFACSICFSSLSVVGALWLQQVSPSSEVFLTPHARM